MRLSATLWRLVRRKVARNQFMEKLLTETKVITWRGIKVDLLCLVQALQSEPVIFVPRCITHSHQLRARAILEVAKVLTLLWVHHGIVLGHHQHKLFQRLKVLLVSRVLVPLHLIVDVGQEMPMSPVLHQVFCITVVVCLRQSVLHKGRVDPGMRDDGINRTAQRSNTWHTHGTLWKAIHAHHNTMHRQESLHWWIVVFVNVATDHSVAL
mmetsp:Transcript_41518/g.90052  ORF Transcript_41518/g.90052 Transcript_41518/m.90052 type:complete len:210 (-) Transcript_41518:471-1100(-)